MGAIEILLRINGVFTENTKICIGHGYVEPALLNAKGAPKTGCHEELKGFSYPVEKRNLSLLGDKISCISLRSWRLRVLNFRIVQVFVDQNRKYQNKCQSRTAQFLLQPAHILQQ